MLSIVMFSTSTCVHCKPLKATLETLEYEYDESELEISHVIIDKQENGMALANEWQVAGVPTLLFIDNGELLARSTGATPLEELRKHVTGLIQRHVFSEQSAGGSEAGSPVLCCPSGSQD